MTTHVLQADTLISSLLPSGGGSLASGDTINFNGHTLIMDCDAVDFPFTPANSGGVRCKLELRDLSRIDLNASLPSTVHPWVDPEHPLPVSTPGVANGIDGYVTGFTANARAEIRCSGTGGKAGLGGGSAMLPTETRCGHFWARVSAVSGTTVIFDRDLDLHQSDIIRNVTFRNGSKTYSTVVTYDRTTCTATLSDANMRANDFVFVVAGGVMIYLAAYPHSTTTLTAPMSAGTLNIHGTSAANGLAWTGTNSAFIADRATCFANSVEGASCYLFGPNVSAKVRQLAGDRISNTSHNVYVEIGECLSTGLYVGPLSRCRIGGGRLLAEGTFSGELSASNTTLPSIVPSIGKSAAEYNDCLVNGSASGATIVLKNGTVTRTSRTDFPTDTDLPDAQYHVPNAADAVTWRYEDRWVRKGETLRMRARWMPAGASSRASVAVTELATWWPDLWTLGADALAKAEFVAGMEQLKWHDGSLEWRNDTGVDCQVRVWECVSGDTLGGYLRVWEATGGAM